MGDLVVAFTLDTELRRRLVDRNRVSRMAALVQRNGAEVHVWSSGQVVAHAISRVPPGCPSTVSALGTRDFEQLIGATIGGGATLSDSTLEVATPQVAWRTLWYGRTERIAVVSTSLRLCAYHLGSLELDRTAFVQFAATGTLGPTRSWDARVGQVPSGHTVSATASGLTSRPSEWKSARALTDEQAIELLKERVRASISDVVREGQWIVPLSGGYDSRGLLLMAPSVLPTITWGDTSSLRDPASDSSIAARLAAAVGSPHEFLAIEQVDLPPMSAVDRFVEVSEGRIDHIDGYADGFRLWESLAERGAQGILRGDEAFGAWDRRTECGVRRRVGAISPDEIVADRRSGAVGDLNDLWRLAREPDQSLASYRDALYRSFRGPSILAPLNQVKASFVDVRCPYLDDRVVSAAVQMEDEQRTDKRVFCELVRSLSPDVPFATRSALAQTRFVARPDVQSELRVRLDEGATPVVSPELRSLLVEPSTESPARRSPVRRWVARHGPRRVVKGLSRRSWDSPVALSIDRLRLRAVIAEGAYLLLQDCAGRGAVDLLGEEP